MPCKYSAIAAGVSMLLSSLSHIQYACRPICYQGSVVRTICVMCAIVWCFVTYSKQRFAGASVTAVSAVAASEPGRG